MSLASLSTQASIVFQLQIDDYACSNRVHLEYLVYDYDGYTFYNDPRKRSTAFALYTLKGQGLVKLKFGL